MSKGEQNLGDCVKEMVSICRRHRLDGRKFKYVYSRTRSKLGLKSERKLGQIAPKALSVSEVDRLFAVIEDPKHKLAFRLCLATGLRVAELCALKIADVNLRDKTINVISGKGGKSATLNLPNDLILPLDVHIKANPDCVWVFENNRRGQYSTRYWQLLVSRYAEMAGFEKGDVHMHVFRSTFITNLCRNNPHLSERLLMVASRHSSSSTLQHYLSLTSEDLKKAVNLA